MKIWPFNRTKPVPTKGEGKRSFAGALFGRLVNDWVAQSTAQDSEIRTSLRALRNRSRQLVRDNDFAKNAVRAVQNNVIGQGIQMKAQVKMLRGPGLNDNTSQQIEDLWAQWCRKDNCHAAGILSFQDIERLAMGSDRRETAL